MEESVKLMEEIETDLSVSVVEEDANRFVLMVRIFGEGGERMQELSVSVPGSEIEKSPV